MYFPPILHKTHSQDFWSFCYKLSISMGFCQEEELCLIYFYYFLLRYDIMRESLYLLWVMMPWEYLQCLYHLHRQCFLSHCSIENTHSSPYSHTHTQTLSKACKIRFSWRRRKLIIHAWPRGCVHRYLSLLYICMPYTPTWNIHSDYASFVTFFSELRSLCHLSATLHPTYIYI